MARKRTSKARPGSPRARLFLALELPEAEREALASWRDELVAHRPDLRPVAPEALHVTLVFLGYRPEKEIPAIAASAFAAIEGLVAPLLAPGELVSVPPRRPRLFALDLRDEDGRTTAVQSAMSQTLADAHGYEPERRAFWPHVTLARVKRNIRAKPLLGRGPPVVPFTADQVTLYRSTLRPQGALYEPLERVRLSGAEPNSASARSTTRSGTSSGRK